MYSLQHFPYHHSTGTSPFDIVSLFSWTGGFGIIVSPYSNQYVLIYYLQVLQDTRPATDHRPETYKVTWDTSPCQRCPPRTLKLEVLGFTATHTMPTMDHLLSFSAEPPITKTHQERLVDREQADASLIHRIRPSSILLNHVFKLGSTSDPRCLVVHPCSGNR